MNKETKLATVLILIMLVALFMGCGPGIYLINPDPNDPDAIRFMLGMPIVWLWVVFWFLVEAACIVIAATKLWKGDKS